MKKILIFNVAASSGGALTILNMYYDIAKKDKENEYVFIVSTPELVETKNIKVYNFPKIKKSWFHRIYFELLKVDKLIKKIEPDEIISLQNIYVGKQKNIFQTIYVHQSLPFVSHKYSFFKHPKLFIYQNIIGRLIKKSIVKADKVIVQTEWMKQVCKEITSDKKEIVVETPIGVGFQKFKCEDGSRIKGLFYPAAPNVYKNHITLFKALKILKEKYNLNIKLSVTFDKNDNKLAKKLWKYSKEHNLNVEFMGLLNRNEMINKYCESILIFPSQVESCPLPLIEAKSLNRNIVSSNEAFSKEILESYDKNTFFETTDFVKLAEIVFDLYNEERL